MIRIILFATFALSLSYSHAQTAKKQLTEQDKAAIKKELLDNNASLFMLSLTLNTEDLRPLSSVKSEKESTPEEIQSLKNKLNGSHDDYETYNKLGQIYKRLNQKKEAYGCFEKAFEALAKRMNESPNDNLYKSFAEILVNAENYKSAIAYYEKALEVNSNDTTSYVLLPFCHLYMGNLEMARTTSKNALDKYPENISTHIAYFTSMMYTTYFSEEMRSDTLSGYTNKKIEDIIDLSFLKATVEKHPDRFDMNLMYQLGRQVGILLKLYKTYSKKTYRFTLSSYDLEEMKKMEKFYSSALKNKKIAKDHNYILNKALGILYVMMNKPKEGIPYLQISIKLKGPEFSNFNSNAGESYDGLITAYMLSKDTLSAIKAAEAKITLKPEVYPYLKNYISLSNFYLLNKNYTKARTTIMEAFKLNDQDYDAWMALALVDVYEENLKSAEENAMKIYEMDNSRPDSFLLLGVIYLLKNDFNSAYHCLKRVQEIDPKSEMANKMLSEYFQ